MVMGMMEGVLMAVRWLSECTVRADDTRKDALAKRWGFPVSLLLILYELPLIYFNASTAQWLHMLGDLLAVAGHLAFALCAATNIAPAGIMASVWCLLSTVAVLLFDTAASAASLPREWTYALIVLDGALVVERDSVPFIIVPVMLLYLAVERIEAMTLFGLYEVGQWGNGESQVCSCPAPPCAVSLGTGLVTFAQPAVVLLVTFALTRGFSAGMRTQVGHVHLSIDVATNIAAALARYDISGAEETLAREKDVQPQLAVSFRQILANLRMYKAYLPHSLFVIDDT
eukprot:Hpha_TRINITY_DN15913_c4_g3::TRINITY_DN15913_c4_g3_i1::g.74176::m.74176